MTLCACVFAGPSLREIPKHEVAIYPPARLGSIWRAVERGHRRIGLIDGAFGAYPAVWHKEILYALSQNCTVIGGGSMGALRAAELWPMGMIGRGAIWRLYRRGSLVSDADVALLHADTYSKHLEITVPLVDLRFTLRRLRRRGEISTNTEARAIAALSDIHFTERTWGAMDITLHTAFPNMGLGALIRTNRVRRKEMDALSVIEALQDPRVKSPVPNWTFPVTSFWKHQFQENPQDVPLLDDAV